MTTVPPAVGPEVGVIGFACSAGGATNMKLPGSVAEPVESLTDIPTIPAFAAGMTALIWLEERTVNLYATTPPKVTDVIGVDPVKLAPLIVTVAPPVVGPTCGLTLVTLKDFRRGAALLGAARANNKHTTSTVILGDLTEHTSR